MPEHIPGKKVHSSASKSLYTPVLYDHVPESSVSSTGEVAPCSTYLKRLTREHLARASMEEIEPSVVFSSTSEARVTQLMVKVKRAFAEANGNPADGRWALVSDLLQLRCTRGGCRWLRVNLDSRAPEIPKQLCLIPKTGEEWEELERRIKSEEEVNSKVQRWIRSAEFESLSPDVTVDRDQDLEAATSHPPSTSNPRERFLGPTLSTKVAQTSLKTGSSASHPLSSGSKFGFNVVKQHNVFIKDGKPENSLSSAPPPDRIPLPTSHIPEVNSPPPPHSDNESPDETGHLSSPIPRIGTVNSNSSLIPLSFPDSKIQTSTPLPNLHDQIQKSRLPCKPPSVVPESANFPRNPDQACYEGDASSHRKRARSGSFELPVVKRARVVEEVGHPSTLPPQLEAAEFLVTPSTIRDLPRLTELLALSPRQKRNTPRKRISKSPVAPPMSVHHSNARDHPESYVTSTKPQVKDPGGALGGDNNSPPVSISETPFDTLASGASMIKTPGSIAIMVGDGGFGDPQQAAEPAAELGSEADDVDPSIIEEVLKVQEPQSHTPTPLSPLQKDQFRFPSVDPELMTSKLDTTTYNLYGLDLLESSPAKSLSSLAGSDSESDEDEAADQTLEKITNTVPKRLHHLVDPEFSPQFTSTQKPGLEYNLASNTGLNGRTTSENMNWGNEKLPSTSQLQAEVNSQVDEFDKFMEADLGYDQVVSGL